MAQKYLMAMDYMDFHTQNVLKKHAKKRPLGDIETKHRYTPTQPVLSCRTVDIDVSGTRTYRPKSSADIIQEQHALIHKIYTKARNVTSAPQHRVRSPRNASDDNFQKHQRINSKLNTVEVHGRPLTSQSHVSSPTPRKTPTSSRRPRTTGQLKKPGKSPEFLLIKADSDLTETRRSYRDLTNKIHEQWDPENHDLNVGVFVRGKKRSDINTKQDTWLTFSGSQSEEAQGIIDAFADVEKKSDYYNIEGGVGSRIAQQLQKGDKIRIGINGAVHSQDLKVKKWSKEDKASIPEEGERVKSAGSGKENMEKVPDKVIPLCWEDQLQEGGTKVITPRGTPLERTTINLCETRPVIFNKLIPGDELSVSGGSHQNKQGFRVKQRQKNRAGIDGKEQKNKVTVLSIDARSEEEERKLNDMTVDDVIKQNCDGKVTKKSASAKTDGGHSVTETVEKHVTLNLNIEEHGAEETALTASRGSLADSTSSGSNEYKQPKARPTPPTYSSKSHQVELGIIGTLPVPPNSRPLSSEYDPRSPVPGLRSIMTPKSPQNRAGSARSSRGSNKPMSARSVAKSIGSNSVASIMTQSGVRQVEAEFIQISQPVKNPNPVIHKKPTDFVTVTQSMGNDMMRGPRSHSGIREPLPSPELGVYEDRSSDMNSPPMSPGTKIPPVKPSAPSLAINIPTAEFDSTLDSPSHRNGLDPDSENSSKRAQDMRDEQIDQITTLLGDSIIGQEGETTEQLIS